MVQYVNKYRLINYKIILSDLVSIIISAMDLIMLILFIFFIYLLTTFVVNCINICFGNCLYNNTKHDIPVTEHDIPVIELDRYTIELLEHQLIEIEKQLLLNEIRNFNKLRLRKHKDIIVVINPDNHITIGESI